MRRLENRVILTTGAAGGLGRACALQCSSEGAAVALIDLGQSVATVLYDEAFPTELEQTAAEIRENSGAAITAIADVRNADQLRRAVRQAEKAVGPVDGLVTAAGIDSQGKSWELTDDQRDAMFDINLSGVWKAARAVAPGMIERKQGRYEDRGSTTRTCEGPMHEDELYTNFV